MRCIAGGALVVLFCAGVVPAVDVQAAMDGSADTRARLDALQQQYQQLRQRTERELADLARQIAALRAEADGTMPRTGAPPPPAHQDLARSTSAARDPAASARQAPQLEGLSLSGDFRLRYEHTSDGVDGSPDRDRGVLRGRLGADYRATERVTVGARLVTGDPDDPNSADVTLGNFTDDLQVSLDRAYAHWAGDGASVLGGKFANPLSYTDLVWDGDVNPQGVAGQVRLFERAGLAAEFTGIYALVDEQSGGADSTMAGGQLGLDVDAPGAWRASVDVGYYDYHIGSLAGADAGDIRGNRLDPSGTAYLSDFELLDVIAELTMVPADERWPVTLTADFVHNFGAADAQDTGYSGALSVGRLSAPGDLRVGYGYTVAETDAVFAAYSHDNITYATNYRLHALSLEYVPWPRMRLNLTGYRYRRDEPLPGEDNDPLTRVRLNWSLLF